MQRNTWQDWHHHFALRYKQSEHGNIFCQRQLKELESITYRYCNNLGIVPLTVHCQVIQNDYPEMCSNTCTLQNGLCSKRLIFFCFFNNKMLSCKNCLKQRLSKVILHFKNAVYIRVHIECVVIGSQIYNKNCWFPKHKDYPTVK